MDGRKADRWDKDFNKRSFFGLGDERVSGGEGQGGPSNRSEWWCVVVKP